jgi:class 3 adenylate cyclase/tetratricopeptide (TPR) repeat protein
MKCPKCQNENPEEKKYCRKCGASLSLTCPHCGVVVSADDEFCGDCGQSLSRPAPAPEPVLSTDGERKHVTVLFSDLSGYTAMAEKLDPEEVKEITTRIFGKVAQIVSRYDGFVEKYIGDAVVALFGVPTAHEDDHLRSIRAAKEMHEAVNVISPHYEEKIGRRLTFHSGITTGLVVTGEVNLEKGTHGVAGDTINLASRLSGLAKPGEILVGESTYHQSTGAFSFDKLEPVSVKGKAEPVIPYRLVEEKAEATRGLATQGISSPLVGRNAEMAAIKASVNRLLDGQGGILSVIGEAGLGKSRLMAEIRQTFAHENLLWLEGKTLSYGQKMSYWPFREILWHYSGITEDDSDTEAWAKFEAKIVDLFPAESGEILPYLASLIGLEVRGDLGQNLRYLDGAAMGKQIYLSSRRFFERLAQKPLVLIFEDLHWADESTILLVEHLFPLITRAPLLICGVTRPEAGAPALRLRDTAIKDHERRYTEIRLNPLSPTECTDLMNNLLAIENLPSRIRQLILTKADGNPFFVEEIMRTLVDKGAVSFENGRWRVTSAIETITIPDTIQGVIMARIDRLDEEVKQILKTASVIGRAFLYRLLKEVTEAVRDLDKHLDDLTATELIREKQKVPELEYIFKHALVQESTYESILLKKRMELHGKAASAIETLFSDRLDEFSSVLAYHYAKAENWEKAQEYLFKAGDQAGRIAADAEALTHYQQALETYTRVFGDKWDPVQRGILERKMGEAFYRRGEPEKGMEYLQRALVYFGRPMLANSRWKVRLDIMREIGVQLAHRLFSRSLVKKMYGSSGQAVEEVSRIYTIVATHEVLTAPEHYLLVLLTSLNFYERKGHLSGVVSRSGALVSACFLFSWFRLGRFLQKRAMILAQQTQDPGALVAVYVNLTNSEDAAGRLDQAVEAGLKGVEIARTRGYWNLTMWGYANAWLLRAYCLKGEMRVALPIAREIVRYGQDANEPFVLTVGLLAVGIVQERTGDFQECAAAVARAIELCEAISYHVIRVWAGSYLGRCYCRMGDVDRSLAVLTQADTYRARHRVRGWEHWLSTALLMAYLAGAEQDPGPKSNEYMRKAGEACNRLFKSVKGYPVCLPEATRLQGVYDWLTGKQSSAQQRWQRSLVLAEEMGMRYDLAMTHLEMGRRFKDLEHLRQAEAIFAEIGAEWGLEQAQRYLGLSVERKES